MCSKIETTSRYLTIHLFIGKKKYPSISEKLDLSLRTPQLGPYHNEGPTMKSHLQLMFATAEEYLPDNIHPAVGKLNEIAELIFKEIVDGCDVGKWEVKDDIADYILLHDISKPYRLSLSLEGDGRLKKEITMKDWGKIEACGKPYMYKDKKVISISYFHPSKKGKPNHGAAAKEYLTKNKVECSPKVLKIIGLHDDILSFTSETGLNGYINFLERHSLTEEEINFFIAVTYLDGMASLDINGKPVLGPLVRFLELREKYNTSREEYQKARW